jgi:hypothetical protein
VYFLVNWVECARSGAMWVFSFVGCLRLLLMLLLPLMIRHPSSITQKDIERFYFSREHTNMSFEFIILMPNLAIFT